MLKMLGWGRYICVCTVKTQRSVAAPGCQDRQVIAGYMSERQVSGHSVHAYSKQR